MNKLMIKNYELLIFIAIGIAIFYLSIHFSKDWIHYNWMYENDISTLAWKNFFDQLSLFKEPLFFIASKSISQLFGFTFFVFLSTVVLLTIKLNYLSKIMKSPFLGAFFYICFYILLLEGTAIRVAYATALIIPALYYLQQQKFTYAFLLIILASQIHLTALLFLIVIPLYFFKPLNLAVYLFFIICPLLIIFDVSVLNMLKDFIEHINPKYLYYFKENRLLVQNSTGLYLYFIGFFAILLSLVFLHLKELLLNDNFLSAIFSTSLCGIILMCVFHDFVAVGARFGELLLIPIVILLGYLYRSFILNKMYIHCFILIIASLSYFAARWLYLYPKSVGL